MDIKQEERAGTGWGGARRNSGGARPGAGRPVKPCAPPIDPSCIDRELHWYCVRTAYREEIPADIDIRLLGFEVFAPTLWKAAIPARRGRPGKPDRIVPLFPRYIFTRFVRGEPGWYEIKRQRGVERILGSPAGLPQPVSQAAIDLIRAQLAPNSCMYPPSFRGRPLPAGATVRFADGPLSDYEMICQWSDGARVKLLMRILGRDVSIATWQDAVETV